MAMRMKADAREYYKLFIISWSYKRQWPVVYAKQHSTSGTSYF